MRKLVIKRNKSFAGCLVAMKVYIEDAVASDITIGGVPCRKLGTLKNGETAEFAIGTDAMRVYVIADTLSKEYCNDFYQIPAGEEEVQLSGKNHYNPAAGHPFMFDGVTDRAVVENRKKNNKTGGWILVAAIVLGVVIGVVNSIPTLSQLKDKNVEVEEFNMVLSGDYVKLPDNDFSICYSSENYSVLGFADTSADIEGWSVSEYGRAFIQFNELSGSSLTEKDGLTYTEFSAEGEGETYHYWAFFFKNGNKFWVIQIATDEPADAEDEAYAIKLAKTVTFDAE